MKSNLTTFKGSLGDLEKFLRKLAFTNNHIEIENIFPEIKHGQSVFLPTFKSWLEWHDHPGNHKEMIEQGRAKLVSTFFAHFPGIQSNYQFLYNRNDVEQFQKTFEALLGNLKKVKQYFDISRRKEGEISIANEDIEKALEVLANSLPPGFDEWRPRPPWTINNIDKLIAHAEYCLDRSRVRQKLGRRLKAFSVLVFIITNKFTQGCRDSKKRAIKRQDEYRVRKRWQLVCAALLYLHVLEDIPEINLFIDKHKDEKSDIALGKLRTYVKKEYQNFKRTGKSIGKWVKAYKDGSEILGIYYPAIIDKELRGQYF